MRIGLVGCVKTKLNHPAAARELYASTLFRGRRVVEQVPAVVYIDSNDQRPDSLYISPQAEEMLGYPPEPVSTVCIR